MDDLDVEHEEMILLTIILVKHNPGPSSERVARAGSSGQRTLRGPSSLATGPGAVSSSSSRQLDAGKPNRPKDEETTMDSTRKEDFVLGFWGVRYQVTDVQRSIDFYTETLGFNLDRQHLPAFGQVSVGDLKLVLSGPGASGSRPMPDGRPQEPGGWNRVMLEVKDLPARITELQDRGVRFRNEMEAGPGGRQIQIEDPDGNPIELFEPARG
jgi:glyoxylase I family protein